MIYYELMHRDFRVATFSIDSMKSIKLFVNEENKKHLPLSVIDSKSFVRWLNNRAIPTTRCGAYGVGDTFHFMLDNLGLSLTDNYWIRKSTMGCSWDDVNFYKNDFVSSNDLEELDNNKGFTPNASLQGDLQKKWILTRDKRSLVKCGNTATALQSVSEVIATKIYQSLQLIPYADYQFMQVITDSESVLGCCVRNFTNENLEFVPAIDVINNYQKRNDESYFQMFIRVCEERGLKDVYRFMSVMLSVDFLIANVDRHLNNFGILRNPITLEWVCMAPVFDSGNSLFFDRGHGAKLPEGKDLLETKINSFYKTLVRQMSVVDTGIIDLRKLPSREYVECILRRDTSLKEADVCQRVVLMDSLKQYFKEMQNGKRLWEYDELKRVSSFV